MIKRTTAVYHVLMVSILLLSHAVIPHVHFNSEIVITGLEKHPTKEDCDYNHHKHNDEAGTGTDADFCLLNQVYLARITDTDSESDIAVLLKYFKYSQGFHCTIFSSADDFVYNPETIISYSEFCSPLHSYSGSGNINTRGSPIA